MDKSLHQQLYSGMSRHSLGGASAASLRAGGAAGRKSLGGSVLAYGGGGVGLKKSAANVTGGMGQRYCRKLFVLISEVLVIFVLP